MVSSLYFLTVITVLVVVLGLAIADTIKKRRARRQEVATDSPKLFGEGPPAGR